jgi:hypothetical protein
MATMVSWPLEETIISLFISRTPEAFSSRLSAFS